jgi:hypothetical protein
MEGKEKAVSDWRDYGSDNMSEEVGGGMVFNSHVCESNERQLERGAA